MNEEIEKRKANCLFIVSKVSSNNTAQWESLLVVGGHENEHFSNYFFGENLVLSISLSVKKTPKIEDI